jgi:hypothetical protein
LYAGGYAKAFGDDLAPFQHPSLNAAAEIAQRIRALIDRPKPP